MNRFGLFAMAWVLSLASGYASGSEGLEPLRHILQTRRCGLGSSTPGELRDYAERNGFSDAEMAAQLMELAKEGWDGKADAEQQRVARRALRELADFGGEEEYAFLRDAMRTAADGETRRESAVSALRMRPETVEEVLREVAADIRLRDFERYHVCKAAFWLGRDGDEKTRKRVVEALQEVRNIDRKHRIPLGQWILELEGDDNWEPWLREVVASEESIWGHRHAAYAWAFRVGRDGDGKTRAHVIDVLKELRETESFEPNRNYLRLWLDELEKLP